MKTKPSNVGSLILTAMTRVPFVAVLIRDGRDGYFERIRDYSPGPKRRCACSAQVEAIEEAVDNIVRPERKPPFLCTQRVRVPALQA